MNCWQTGENSGCLTSGYAKVFFPKETAGINVNKNRGRRVLNTHAKKLSSWRKFGLFRLFFPFSVCHWTVLVQTGGTPGHMCTPLKLSLTLKLCNCSYGRQNQAAGDLKSPFMTSVTMIAWKNEPWLLHVVQGLYLEECRYLWTSMMTYSVREHTRKSSALLHTLEISAVETVWGIFSLLSLRAKKAVRH